MLLKKPDTATSASKAIKLYKTSMTKCCEMTYVKKTKKKGKKKENKKSSLSQKPERAA